MTITTNMHPLVEEERNVRWVLNYFSFGHKGNYVYAESIIIGDKVWICANVTIYPNVSIGNGSVIGAGSVVTRDISSGVLTYGILCRENCPFLVFRHDVTNYAETVTNKTLLHKICVRHIRYTIQVI